MIGEDVAQRLLDERRRAASLVEEAHEAADHDGFLGFLVRTPHHEGPTGPEKSPAARS